MTRKTESFESRRYMAQKEKAKRSNITEKRLLQNRNSLFSVFDDPVPRVGLEPTT